MLLSGREVGFEIRERGFEDLNRLPRTGFHETGFANHGFGECEWNPVRKKGKASNQEDRILEIKGSLSGGCIFGGC
ncbi:MAG: hypothetical protein CVU57_25350 [Deltaproteobacteria bacterium HGW-Deltaproteobacteria-15]|nr:MAG: hypothetical protein CVU57_25350 [Deltaproteobacteria bacterium HGW-Deltaproteobacteria-15]